MIARQGLFKQIDNTLLDLQQSSVQTFTAHMRKLGRLLRHDDFKPFIGALTESVKLEEFLSASARTQGGMIGSARLVWPEDDLEILGLKLLLILKFSEDSDYMVGFGHQYFSTGSRKIMSGVHEVVSQLIIPFVRDFKDYVESKGKVRSELVLPMSDRVFIVHGHDGEARETVARFLESIGLEPIILNEQPNKGRTIIEKVEANSDVGFAVVLLTPDDLGRAKGEVELEQRARQNVLLELGYFMAKLGRDKICALRRGDVSIPSDFTGVVWEEMDESGGWRQKLARELEAAGHAVDWQKLKV